MDKDTQLPAEGKPSPLITDLLPAQEVHNLYMQEMKISSELNKEIKKVREYLFDNFGEFSEAKILSYQNGEKHTVDLVKMVATEYATKLHQEQQESAQLKQWKKEQLLVWGPLYDYGLDSDKLKVGGSIPAFILERCKRFDKARTLLEKVKFRHESGLLPDRLLYNEIKQFLDGTK